MTRVDGETTTLELRDRPKGFFPPGSLPIAPPRTDPHVSLTIPLHVAIGAGSIWIDHAFEKKVKEILDELRLEHRNLEIPEDAAHDMAHGANFRVIKETFGTAGATPGWNIPIPGLCGADRRRVEISRWARTIRREDFSG